MNMSISSQFGLVAYTHTGMYMYLFENGRLYYYYYKIIIIIIIIIIIVMRI